MVVCCSKALVFSPSTLVLLDGYTFFSEQLSGWMAVVLAVMLLIGVVAVPIGAEQWLRGSVAGDAWQMSRLSGERPNEKGWENPKASWTGECGDPESPHSVSIVVAGGSSVGGAYQFGGQPDAFFTAIGAFCS